MIFPDKARSLINNGGKVFAVTIPAFSGVICERQIDMPEFTRYFSSIAGATKYASTYSFLSDNTLPAVNTEQASAAKFHLYLQP